MVFCPTLGFQRKFGEIPKKKKCFDSIVVESSHAEIFKFSSSSSSFGMLPVFDQFILSKQRKKHLDVKLYTGIN